MGRTKRPSCARAERSLLCPTLVTRECYDDSPYLAPLTKSGRRRRPKAPRHILGASASRLANRTGGLVGNCAGDHSPSRPASDHWCLVSLSFARRFRSSYPSPFLLRDPPGHPQILCSRSGDRRKRLGSDTLRRAPRLFGSVATEFRSARTGSAASQGLIGHVVVRLRGRSGAPHVERFMRTLRQEAVLRESSVDHLQHQIIALNDMLCDLMRTL